jgi:hypothetical protein
LIPHLLDLPHVHLDPAILVVYYGILYHGYSLSGNDSDRWFGKNSDGFARKIYIACLRSLPGWQREATGTTTDLMAALFMVF